MTYQTLSIDRSETVGVITFRRGDQLNAMNALMMDELTRALHEFEADPQVAAIVLTGEGRAFMAGADIKEYAAFTHEEFVAFQAAGAPMYARIEDNAKPVIAAVNGYALGGGFEIVLACDLVVASRSAKMGLPEIQLALVPGGGGTQRLARKVGHNRAIEMLLTGRARPAEDLVAWGLVNRVVDGDPLDEAIALARQATEVSSLASATLKRLVRQALSEAPEIGQDAEFQALCALRQTADAQARIAQFAARSAAKQG